MKKFIDVCLNQYGDPIQGVACTVLQYPSNATANIFSDNGVTQTTNPVYTDSQGMFSFYTGNGRYSITFTGSGVTKDSLVDVLIEDPAEQQAYNQVGGSINDTPIGAVTPSTGNFTTLTAASLSLAAYNGPVGTTTPNVGYFTTLNSIDLNVTNVANIEVTLAQISQSSYTLLGSTWAAPGGIGLTTPASGAFTTLSSNGATSLGAVNATSINSTPIGDTTPSSGAFTTLAVSSGIDNIPIGAGTASTGRFTTLVATSGINSTNIGATTAGTGRFTTLVATSGINSTAIGATTPSTGVFTTATITTANITTANITNWTITSNFSMNASTLFQGDFSNATLANRTLFKSSTLNGESSISIVPNGSSTSASVKVYNTATPTNSGIAYVGITTTEAQFVSGISGSGTYLPLTLYTNGAEKARIDVTGNFGIGKTPVSRSTGGNLEILGNISTNSPIAKTAAFTVGDNEASFIVTGTASVTATLPAAASFPGRWIYIVNRAAFTTVSASSNVVPKAGGAAGTAICAATAGTWAALQSDGTNWQIMAGGA